MLPYKNGYLPTICCDIAKEKKKRGRKMKCFENKKRNCYFIILAILLLLASYPVYMGAKVIFDMIANGNVAAEDYPKYVIPYAPIAFSLLLSVALLPLFAKCLKKWAFPAGAALSVGTFFIFELLLEKLVIVQNTHSETVAKLKDWQMYMCAVQPIAYETRTWTTENVLEGEYTPAYKLHFYLISVVLILALLGVAYGFYGMYSSGNMKRKKTLIMQAVAAGAFLSMCIWACFTAFYRTGELTVSPLSASLMCLFFLLMGLTVGLFVGSFFIGKKKTLLLLLPSVCACVVCTAMYIGELILLHGNLYTFGSGFFFAGLPLIVLAPVDILVILLSGGLTALLLWAFGENKEASVTDTSKETCETED